MTTVTEVEWFESAVPFDLRTMVDRFRAELKVLVRLPPFGFLFFVGHKAYAPKALPDFEGGILEALQEIIARMGADRVVLYLVLPDGTLNICAANILGETLQGNFTIKNGKLTRWREIDRPEFAWVHGLFPRQEETLQ